MVFGKLPPWKGIPPAEPILSFPGHFIRAARPSIGEQVFALR